MFSFLFSFLAFPWNYVAVNNIYLHYLLSKSDI